MQNITLSAVALALVAGSANATITVYNDFASYNNAVGGNHTIFEDFEGVDNSGDVDGNGRFDVLGNVFNGRTVYSSPDAGNLSSYVNIADIGEPVRNEIGPMGEWNGRLRWNYDADFVATGFTGVDLESNSVVRFFKGREEVGAAQVGGVGETFRFVGFVSTVAFDRVELGGEFYAIDGHYSTVPAPGAAALLGLGALAAGRRRR